MSAAPPSPSPAPIRVAFLEDYPPMRDSLARMLSNQPRCRLVAGCATLPALMDALAKEPADVVLMDLQLGSSMDGIRATREVRGRFPATMILVLTLYDQPGVVFEALSAGAVGYLLKSATPEAILQGIEEVASGGAPMTGSIARMVIERLLHGDPSRPPVQPDNADDVRTPDGADILSYREAQVLGALASGCRYKEVAAKLGVSHNTIRSHVRRIFEKLHAHGVQEATRKAHAAGVRLPG